jgi:predicted nuclease with TOPRIM domain
MPKLNQQIIQLQEANFGKLTKKEKPVKVTMKQQMLNEIESLKKKYQELEEKYEAQKKSAERYHNLHDEVQRKIYGLQCELENEKQNNLGLTKIVKSYVEYIEKLEVVKDNQKKLVAGYFK